MRLFLPVLACLLAMAPSVAECQAQFIDDGSIWTWRLLPSDVLYRSYLGDPREPRLSSAWLYDTDHGWLWEFEIGGRVGLLRFGTADGPAAEGWELDVWGAAFPRLNLEYNNDLDAVDFHVGVPLTWKQGPFQTKIEIRHMSAHLGDEFLIRNPGYMRRNYVRDEIAVAGDFFLNPDLRTYAEAAFAFHTDGGAEPWQFQVGVDYSPRPVVAWLGWSGMPFAAVAGQLREEVDFGGGVNVVAGWQFRGPQSGRLLRVGLQYYNGKSFQASFFDDHEELIGVGLWYDY